MSGDGPSHPSHLTSLYSLVAHFGLYILACCTPQSLGPLRGRKDWLDNLQQQCTRQVNQHQNQKTDGMSDVMMAESILMVVETQTCMIITSLTLSICLLLLSSSHPSPSVSAYAYAYASACLTLPCLAHGCLLFRSEIVFPIPPIGKRKRKSNFLMTWHSLGLDTSSSTHLHL